MTLYNYMFMAFFVPFHKSKTRFLQAMLKYSNKRILQASFYANFMFSIPI